MDILRLFTGLMLLAMTMMTTRLMMHADGWRSAVSALNLRWEREQRQAITTGVSLQQRQAVQTEFEKLVANRPYRLASVHLVLGIAAAIFSLLLAWNQGDLRWIGLWLVLPLGLTMLGIFAYGWSLVIQANEKLARTSASLYGPAPPRVKISSLHAPEAAPTDP